MKFKRHLFGLYVVLPLLLLVTLQAVASDHENYRFRWESSPLLDDNGISLASVVEYEIWIQRGSDAEELLARVELDTTYVLSAEPSIVQRIRVVGVSADGVKSLPSEWSDNIYFETTRGPVDVPNVAMMQSNYPNPFNPKTNLVYGIPESLEDGMPVRLEIYGIDGRLVKSLEVDRNPGWHEVAWDGKDNRGNQAATGVYLSRLLVGTVVETKKMTMLK